MIQLSTKARTLDSLKNQLKTGHVCDALFFTVVDWRSHRQNIMDRIQQKFDGQPVIVRSSAVIEDGPAISMAGAFDSVKNVDSVLGSDIAAAVDRVIRSYGAHASDSDEVLVQPMIRDVSMSGVVFSHDLNTGAPYYVIDYDDTSGKTDTVTSGTLDTSRTLLIHRSHVAELRSSRFRALLRTIQEIEALSPFPGLDIEFAVTRDEEIYIFQVRRLGVQENWNRDVSRSVDTSLGEISDFIARHLRPGVGTLGSQSIFGEMSDWNPAEMIGVVPRPLSRSLYETLITNRIWGEARAEMGYRDQSRHPLMISLGGRAYIDVRQSFNSFLPADLPPEIGEKLVDAWLKRLKENPELHDKVEFEVAVTAYSFDFDQRIAVSGTGLNRKEIGLFRDCLRRLTNALIGGHRTSIEDQLAKVRRMDSRRRSLLAEEKQGNPIERVRELLSDCAEFGTKPFSILARDAFIAEGLLRSMASTNILPAERLQQFRSSIDTVLTEFLNGMAALQANQMDRGAFMETFGHLRPGTYDILAFRYDQREEFVSSAPGKDRHPRSCQPFRLCDAEIERVNRALEEHGFETDCTGLFNFIQAAISGREYSKLVFSRNISDALELIAGWGIGIGLNRNELSFLTIEEIFRCLVASFHDPMEQHFRLLAKRAEEDYKISHAIRLPYLISEPSDVYIVPLLKSRTNFITKERVQAPLYFISGHELEMTGFQDHIVLIERADPGYDWIFLNPIKGLITKYGGANSHMAIRCAELAIPAGIGCGEQLFEQLRQAESGLLDCGAGLIVPVR